MKFVNLSRLIAFFIMPILLTGCPSPALNLKPGTTSGKVYISEPKISTRERLVNDRYQQDAWLNKQLAESDEKIYGYEGSMERRSFQAITSKVGIQADPSKIKLYKLQQENDQEVQKNKLESLKNENIINQIKFQKAKKLLEKDDGNTATTDNQPDQATKDQIAAIQAQIKDLQSKITASSNNSLDIPGKSTDNSKAVMDLADKIIELDKKIDVLTTSNNPKLVNSGISSSPTDQFQDALEGRNVINTEKRKNLLDERHDFAGNTLYSLGFDVSVLPGNDTGAWAVVEVEIEKPSATQITNTIAEDFDSFIIKLEKSINERFYVKTQLLECLKTTELNEDKIAKIVGNCFDNIPDELKSSLILTINDLINSRLVIDKKVVGNKVKADAVDANKVKADSSNDSKNQVTVIKNQLNSIKRLTNKLFPISFEKQGKSSIVNESKILSYTLASKLYSLYESCSNGKESEHIDPKKNFAISRYCSSLISNQRAIQDLSDLVDEIRKAAIYALRYNSIELENQNLKKLGLEIEIINPENKNSITDSYLYVSPIGKERKTIFDSADQETTKNEIICTIAKTISNSINKSDFYAYAVTPADSVQRISDVASQQVLTDFIVSSSLLAGGAVGIDQYLDVVNSNQGIYNAIRRQPLVVGFSDRQPSIRSEKDKIKFGWILGPRFTTANDGKSGQFRHAAVQNSLTAQISVPEWWPEMTVKTSYKWIDEQGVELNLSKKDLGVKRTVSLPSDILDLTKSLNHFSLSSIPQPYKREYSGIIDQPGSFVIKGENLWRSTTVTLGGQKADRIEVLPSMKGIIASFSKLGSLSDQNNDLIVWTSAGDASAGKVNVSSTAQVALSVDTFKPTPSYAIVGKEVQFEVSDNLFKKIDGVTVEVTTSKAGPWVSCSGFARTADGFSVNLPSQDTFKTSKLNVSNGQLLYFRVMTIDKLLLQSTNQPVLYLTESDKELKTTVKKSNTKDVFDLEVIFPKSFELAFPEAIKDNASKTVSLNINNDKLMLNNNGECKVTAKKNSCKVKVTNKDSSIEQKFIISASEELKSIELTLTK